MRANRRRATYLVSRIYIREIALDDYILYLSQPEFGGTQIWGGKTARSYFELYFTRPRDILYGGLLTVVIWNIKHELHTHNSQDFTINLTLCTFYAHHF